MTTARDIITLALKEATVLGVGQTPLAEDINDCFKLLRNMLAQWQKRRWMVPALVDISMIGNDQRSNTIGPGGYWNIQRPVDIKGGYVVQLNTGQTPVSLPLIKIFSYEDYIRIAVKSLNSLPDHFFYDGAYPLGNVFIWPIPSSIYECHLLVERQLAFTGIADGTIVGGAGYVDGTYLNVSFTGGRGTDATANITVSGNTVTELAIINPGKNYVVSDVLSASNVDLGGAGSGFTYTVTELDQNLDYEFDLPEEYEEAIHYNLAIRMISMYAVENPSPQTGVLAKVALNTIKKANSQIPTLVMPRGLRRRGGFNLYNPDGYGTY